MTFKHQIPDIVVENVTNVIWLIANYIEGINGMEYS